MDDIGSDADTVDARAANTVDPPAPSVPRARCDTYAFETVRPSVRPSVRPGKPEAD